MVLGNFHKQILFYPRKTFFKYVFVGKHILCPNFTHPKNDIMGRFWAKTGLRPGNL